VHRKVSVIMPFNISLYIGSLQTSSILISLSSSSQKFKFLKYSKKWGNYFKKIRRHKLAHAGLGCAMRKKIGRYPFIVKIWLCRKSCWKWRTPCLQAELFCQSHKLLISKNIVPFELYALNCFFVQALQLDPKTLRLEAQ
jgi:hypothetical protein